MKSSRFTAILIKFNSLLLDKLHVFDLNNFESNKRLNQKTNVLRKK